jgi:hypothetical protein
MTTVTYRFTSHYGGKSALTKFTAIGMLRISTEDVLLKASEGESCCEDTTYGGDSDFNIAC